jgi:hypothetical protein
MQQLNKYFHYGDPLGFGLSATEGVVSGGLDTSRRRVRVQVQGLDTSRCCHLPRYNASSAHMAIRQQVRTFVTTFPDSICSGLGFRV